MPVCPAIHESSVLIHKANWQTYVALRDEDENRHVLPGFPFDRVTKLLRSCPADATAVIREFRAWIREQPRTAPSEP